MSHYFKIQSILEAFNPKEKVSLRFIMIMGVPPRNVLGIRNMWNGDYWYGKPTDHRLKITFLQFPVFIDSMVQMARLKIINTGHGQGGNENCAEFCRKCHEVTVDGIKRFDQCLWKDDCGLTALHPQGGAWTFNRSNWCPGDQVPVDNFEITPYLVTGNNVILDYNMEPFTWDSIGWAPAYAIASQLVTYGAPNFNKRC